MTKSQGFFMIAKFWLNWLMDDLPRLGYITKLKNKKRKKKRRKYTHLSLFYIKHYF